MDDVAKFEYWKKAQNNSDYRPCDIIFHLVGQTHPRYLENIITVVPRSKDTSTKENLAFWNREQSTRMVNTGMTP